MEASPYAGLQKRAVPGGIATSVGEVEEEPEALPEEGTPAAAAAASRAAADAYLQQNPQIFDDVKAAIDVAGYAGLATTTADERGRIEQYIAMLDKDIAAKNSDPRYNYPFRAALFAIAWNNGVQEFFTNASIDATEAAQVEKALNKARLERKQARAAPPPPQQESARFRRIGARGRLLLETDPVTAAAVHVAGEGAVALLKRLAGEAGQSVAAKMTSADVQLVRRLFNLSSVVSDMKAVANSPFVAQGADLTDPSKMAAFRMWIKTHIGESLVQLWQNVDPRAVVQVISDFDSAITELTAAPSVKGVTSDMLMGDCTKIAGSKLAGTQKPTTEFIYSQLVNELSTQGSSESMKRLGALAAALGQMPPAHSSPTFFVRELGEDVAVGEINAAAKCLIRAADATSNMSMAILGRAPIKLLTKRGAIILSGMLGFGLLYELGDLAFTDMKQIPEDLEADELYIILKSSKIRAAAFQAQQEIVSYLEPDQKRLIAADGAMLALFDSTDSLDVTTAEMETVKTKYSFALKSLQ